MYLTKLNKKTGLLEIEDEHDGILGIKAFRDVIEDKNLGLECMTVIAFVVDYLSPLRFYIEKDRPRKSMEEVTGKRDAFVWDQEKIQVALKKYDELQYDPTLEQGRIYFESKVQKLLEYKEAAKYYGKKHNLKDADGNELIFESPVKIRKQISEIDEDIEKHEKRIQGKDTYEKAPVRNGYKLTRLEQKLEKKNSFYNQIR